MLVVFPEDLFCTHLVCQSSWPPSGPQSVLSLDKYDLGGFGVAVHIIAIEITGGISRSRWGVKKDD